MAVAVPRTTFLQPKSRLPCTAKNTAPASCHGPQVKRPGKSCKQVYKPFPGDIGLDAPAAAGLFRPGYCLRGVAGRSKLKELLF